jgi:DNA repair exonuclease SbcCD ATPase subunit
MGHARLKRLWGKAFRSLVQPFEVSFPESGLMLFRGHNLDTGGSSGSGKSSLLLAITHLLGFCRYAGTSLQSWQTEEAMEVGGEFEVSEGILEITRGKKLTLKLNGSNIPGSAKQLEEKLTQLLGLNTELLSALTYRGQKQPGLFLSKTDSEKKEFLTILLDLLKFESQVEKSQERAKLLENEVRSFQYTCERLISQLNAIEIKPAILQNVEVLERDFELATKTYDRIAGQVQTYKQRTREAEKVTEEQIKKFKVDAEAPLKDLEDQYALARLKKPDESSIDRSNLTRVRGDLEQAKAFLAEEQAFDDLRRAQQRQKADGVKQEIGKLQSLIGSQAGLMRQQSLLAAEISKLESSICPTCERQWDDAKAKISAAKTTLADLQFQISSIEAQKPRVEALNAEWSSLSLFIPNPAIGELTGIVQQLKTDVAVEEANVETQRRALKDVLEKEATEARMKLTNAKLEIAKAVDAFRAKQTERLQADQDVLETLERELVTAVAHVQGIEHALNKARLENAKAEAEEGQARNHRSRVEVELAAAQTTLEELQSKYNAEMDFQRLVGREGFLGAIFDEVLWEISEETNQLLAQFPNTAHVTLHFRSETTTQKGSLKKSITPVISVGGHEAPLGSGLSGGMETAVELAVDLAVATVVSRRTGAVPGWLILDESFTGLGPVEAEASMEILRAFAETRLVLVVDHASEFKSMFTQFVDVTYERGQSRVSA